MKVPKSVITNTEYQLKQMSCQNEELRMKIINAEQELNRMQTKFDRAVAEQDDLIIFLKGANNERTN